LSTDSPADQTHDHLQGVTALLDLTAVVAVVGDDDNDAF
jgi:hypothetical protein